MCWWFERGAGGGGLGGGWRGRGLPTRGSVWRRGQGALVVVAHGKEVYLH